MTEETKEEKQENQLVPTNVVNDTKLTKLSEFSSAEEMLKYAELLISSKLVPTSFKSPEQLVAVILQGKELGFGPVTAINNIHNIQGRATLSVHAIAALLKNAGISYKLIEDGVFVRKDGTVDKTKVADVEYADKRTTIRFYEKPKSMNIIIENDISFSLSEAKSQGLLEKDNWKRMQLIMLRARCLAIGARFVAPNALLGMYETTEWADVSGITLELDEDGNIKQ